MTEAAKAKNCIWYTPRSFVKMNEQILHVIEMARRSWPEPFEVIIRPVNEIAELKQREQKLIEALRFYANCKEIKVLIEKDADQVALESTIYGSSMNYIEYSEGGRARATLKELGIKETP